MRKSQDGQRQKRAKGKPPRWQSAEGVPQRDLASGKARLGGRMSPKGLSSASSSKSAQSNDGAGKGEPALNTARSALADFGPMRIARAMARAGLCSRREAERWIAEGRVSVNGRVLASPAVEVTATDTVLVDGKPLPAAEPARLWRYYKPRGLVTTHVDPQGRPTVFQKLPPELGRVISVGRLDFNTEGLLLLTNDGALARHLELPATGWIRRYRVRAHGRVSAEDLKQLEGGISIDGVDYGPVTATIDSTQGANTWLTVAIREGKNREVRKILAHLGLEVARLIRISFGPFELGSLATGAVEAIKRRHIADAVGKSVAGELGLIETSQQRRERHARGAERGRSQEQDAPQTPNVPSKPSGAKKGAPS
jgi:23S rRNA pseudouridine2605 synthase